MWEELGENCSQIWGFEDAAKYTARHTSVTPSVQLHTRRRSIVKIVCAAVHYIILMHIQSCFLHSTTLHHTDAPSGAPQDDFQVRDKCLVD